MTDRRELKVVPVWVKNRRRWRTVTRMCSALLAGCALSGCTAAVARPPGTVTAGNLPSTVFAVRLTSDDQFVSFGGVTLCSTGPDAQIVDITPASTDGDFRLRDWGVRPNPFSRGQQGFGLGVDQKISSVDGFEHGLTVGSCAVPDQMVELGVEVGRGSSATAIAHKLVIHFRMSGVDGTATIDWSLVLCGPHDQTGSCTGVRTV